MPARAGRARLRLMGRRDVDLKAGKPSISSTTMAAAMCRPRYILKGIKIARSYPRKAHSAVGRIQVDQFSASFRFVCGAATQLGTVHVGPTMRNQQFMLEISLFHRDLAV